MNRKLGHRPLDSLEQRFQALRDQVEAMPDSCRFQLETALHEVSQAIAALRAEPEAGDPLPPATPGGGAAPGGQAVRASRGFGAPPASIPAEHVRNLTEGHLAEKALRESEGRFRTLIEESPEWLLVTDVQGTVLAASRTAAQRIGKNLAEVTGASLYKLFSPRVTSRRRPFFEQAVATGRPVRFEDARDHFHFEIHINPILEADGQVSMLSIMALDITHRKQAEAALFESEARFRAIFEAAQDPIFIKDRSSRYIQVNPAMERLIGLSNREIVGRSDQELFTAEVAAHFREEDEQALSGKIIRIIDAGPFLEGHRTFHKVKVPIYDATGKIVVGLCGIARDITDLKQAEVALRESEERFRMLFEYAPDAYILADAQGEIIDCNQATEDLAGYGREELIGNNFACLPWLDFREQVRLADRLAQAARGEVLGPVSFTLARKDGGELFAEGMSLPLYIQGQNLVLTIARDVTARKQAEAALQESEARYRALFDASPDAIIVIDMGMNFVMGNWRGLEIWGIDSLDQSKFKNATEYIVPEDRLRVMAAMQELMATGRTQTFETTMIKHDGSRFPSLNSAVLIRDSGGRPQAILGIARDISALKQAEAELRESERRFRLMAETIQDVFWIASAGLEKMIYISPGYEQVWGRTCQELYQSPPSFLEAIHPEDRERFEHEIDAAKAQSLAFSEEYRIIRPDKTVRWIQDRGYPVRDGQGRVIMYTGVATDITERKAMEQQLLQAQKMEAVGRLAGGVAHDFNNLLMAITGYGELMRAMVLKDDPLYGYLDNILKVGERAAALTQQLLTFSRQQIVTPQLIDLNRAVLDLEPMLRRLIGEDLDLEVVMDRRLGAVKADPGQLGQIIMNLVVNARDAMPQGGRLTLKTAAVELEKSRHTRFGLAPPGAYVTLVVQDTGVGMDEATQAHAFEPFFTTKELGKGTGLGLSTVYGIVQQSGAYLDLASEPGAGSVFTIYWPRLDQVVEPPREKIAINAGYRGEETILLVEDEDVLRGLLAKFLRLHGYSVLEARHGGEALLNCEQHPGPIHLLVTDVVMPQVSGRELADRLAPLRPEMKIIYMSGYTEDTLVQHGVTELSMAFLQKPFKPIELARRVYAVLHPPGGR